MNKWYVYEETAFENQSTKYEEVAIKVRSMTYNTKVDIKFTNFYAQSRFPPKSSCTRGGDCTQVPTRTCH